MGLGAWVGLGVATVLGRVENATPEFEKRLGSIDGIGAVL